MRRQNASEPAIGKARRREDRPFRILLVDQEPGPQELLARVIVGERMTLTTAASVAEARSILAQGPVDLALIEPNLPDGSGIELANEIKRNRPITQTIVITGDPSLERAIEAIRAGAVDFISKPLDLHDLNQRVRNAIDRHRLDKQQCRRFDRLRRVCKKLGQAHEEVTRQVDVLCNDLVTAYQELAQQMQQVAQTSEFAVIMRHELDLEQVLHKTLEYLLEKAGPSNVAIYLPAGVEEYTLSGYVNYEGTAESASVLLEHLADVVSPKIADSQEALHLTDDASLAQHFGGDVPYLEDSHLIGFTCRHEDEPLAVVILFRHSTQPFPQSLVQTCTVIAPLLGNCLARVIRVHHRHLPGLDDQDPLAPDY